ncbi:glycosyltransferase, partial [bacterium]|nr:glycosyltransferase [bacterium]
AGLVAMVAASLCGIKERIHIFQGEVWASRSGPMRLLLKSADRLTALLATRVLVVSKSELNFLITEGVLKAVDKAQVLGEGTICGVNLNKFRPNPDKRKEVRSALSIPNHAVICLFLGRLSKDKGLFDLALAFSGAAKEVHNLYLVITGPDEERIIGRVFQKIPTELQFRVRYTGFSYAPQDILSSADFLCLPSYREGFGMVILEAAAVGIPSIANDIYGIRDAIEAGRTGELVPVKNIKDLKSMMIIWSKNPSMLAEYGSLARSRVREKFDQELVIKLYTQYFNVIAEGIKK